MKKAPLESVVVPFDVPFTRTDTPGTGDLSTADVTCPVIVCASADTVAIKRKATLSKVFFMNLRLGLQIT
jgi:hypothetical protein